MLPEPFVPIVLLVVLPVLHQLYKIWKERNGKPLSKLANQGIAFGLATLVVALSEGGFAGLPWPAFPVWGDDIPSFLTGVFEFGKQFLEVMTLAYGAVAGCYEVIHKRWMEYLGFATKQALGKRRS